MSFSASEPKNTLGLTDIDIEEIISVLKQSAEVEEAIVFGSRAKGNYRAGSDVDMALKGKEVTFRTISGVSNHLNEETNLPYRFDIVNYATISNPDLVAHIDRVGLVIYQKGA
jgi:uncharacterized protein